MAGRAAELRDRGGELLKPFLTGTIVAGVDQRACVCVVCVVIVDVNLSDPLHGVCVYVCVCVSRSCFRPTLFQVPGTAIIDTKTGGDDPRTLNQPINEPDNDEWGELDGRPPEMPGCEVLTDVSMEHQRTAFSLVSNVSLLAHSVPITNAFAGSPRLSTFGGCQRREHANESQSRKHRILVRHQKERDVAAAVGQYGEPSREAVTQNGSSTRSKVSWNGLGPTPPTCIY